MLTISGKDTARLELLLRNTAPDLGPPLRTNIYINDHLIDGHHLHTEYTLSEEIPVSTGDNFIVIEHHDRHDHNTEMGKDGKVNRSAMIEIVGLWINKVMFRCDDWNCRNVFEPRYDDSFLDWARKHQANTNFPNQVKPDKYIGVAGRAKIYFMWPLHLHGLYHRIYHKR